MFSEYDGRVLKMRLRQLTNRRPHGSRIAGPRIAVVANCQTFGIAYAMDMLVAGATVEPIQILLGNRTTPELLATVLRDYDFVFGLRHISNHLKGNDSLALERLLPRAHWFPLFYFGGFHPDFVHLQAEAAPRPVMNAFGVAHSAIVAAAFRLGLPQSAAISLLREDVYEALGYFDVWQASWDEMIRVSKECGLDYTRDMVRWMRTGCFMHAPIHPKAHVMFDIARQLLEKAGIATRDVEFPHYAVDRLADDVVLPVYPAIAHRLGLKGDHMFKRASHPGPKDRPYFYDLEDFVTISYESYAKAGMAAVSHPRIEGWLRSPEICDLFRSSAKS